MFEAGEYVVYGSKGVCLVQEITKLDIPDSSQDRLYYVLVPADDKGGRIYAPTDGGKVVMRKVLTKQEATRLIGEIPQIGELRVTDEKQREHTYKEALGTCDHRALIGILKTLYLRKKERLAQGKKFTALDERYLKAAEGELYTELSLALGISKKEVGDYVERQITPELIPSY